MNPDGDFEFYKFIWSGADQGWGVYSYPSESGIKVVFKNKKPSALEIKAIRNCWPRLANKTVSEAKSILSQDSYVFGKWNYGYAISVLGKMTSLGVEAEVVDVPNYSVVNMKTRVAAQIRCGELYDLVSQTLIDNGGEIITHSGIYPNGAIGIDVE